MTKDRSSRLLGAAIVIAVFTAALMLADDAREAREGSDDSRALPDLYAELAGYCADDSCCLDSVEAMRARRGTPQPMTGCDAGQTAEILPCPTSYRWCY